MGATYARILHKISSIRANMSLAQRVFKWIICAKRPMLITELTEAVAFQATDRCWNAEKIPDASRTIQACKNLVVLDEIDNTVRLAHHSVRKFLLDPATQDSVPEFHIELRQGSIEAGELCVAYLSFSDFERQLSTPSSTFCRLNGEVPDPSAILHGVRASPTSGHLSSSIIGMRQLMGKGGTTKQPSSFEFNKLVSLRRPAPPSLLGKYLFLNYAVENWIGHTSDFSHPNRRMWSLFKDLAMDKPMPFDIRAWGDMRGSISLPYTGLFRWAVDAGHVPLLKLLLELPEGLDLRAYCRQDEKEGRSAEFNASRQGHVNVIELLAHRGSIGKQLLVEAAEKGDYTVVQVLLRCQRGLDRDTKVKALQRAAELGQVAIVHLVLDVMDHLRIHDDGVRLTLLAAVRQKWVEIVILLLDKGSSRTSGFGNLPGYPLHEAAQRGLVEVVGLLLENGADVNWRNKWNYTPMHEAALNFKPGIVRLLIDNEADIEATTGDGKTVLHLAAGCGDEETVQLLLERGADVKKRDGSGLTPLQCAASHPRSPVGEMLIKNGGWGY